jgi:uncharacterized protein YggE
VQHLSETTGRRIYYLAAVAIVAIVLISAIAATRPLNIQTGISQTATKTLQVTGEGTVTASPDQAILFLAVQTQATSATQATGDNAILMSKVIDALVGVGISKDSIETLSYSLTPIYENKPDQTTPPRVVGYIARNAIQVTVTDFSSVGKLLDAAITAGVNEVQGVEFALSSRALATLQRQAMQLAVQDADAQAKAMASTLGVNLVGPISVSPGYSYQPRFDKISLSAQTPIQPATLQITATVQVTYEFA